MHTNFTVHELNISLIILSDVFKRMSWTLSGLFLRFNINCELMQQNIIILIILLYCSHVTSSSFWVATWLDVMVQRELGTLFFYNGIINLRKVLNVRSEIQLPSYLQHDTFLIAISFCNCIPWIRSWYHQNQRNGLFLLCVSLTRFV